MSPASTRRAHTKSRTGCQTCKIRKVRCDEYHPQCRNCTKRKVRCPYMDDSSIAPEASSARSTMAEFHWPQDIEDALWNWQRSGLFPLAHMQLEATPSLDTLSEEDRRLLCHPCIVSRDLEHIDSAKLTWAHKIPDFVYLASQYDFVMHALLSLSATHIAITTKSAFLDQVSFAHRGSAFSSLSKAVGSLSCENADAVLAASVILSWQSPDWRAWAALMQGVTTLSNTMQPWKSQSRFQEFLEDNMYRLRVIPPYQSPLPEHKDLPLLEGSVLSIEKAMAFVVEYEDQVKSLRTLLDFVQNLRISPPGRSTQEQFKALHPIRAWIIWLPISFLQVTGRSLQVLVTLAHFYAITLAVQLQLPAPGPAYYPSLRLEAIESLSSEIDRFAASVVSPEGIEKAMELMRFPKEVARYFRSTLRFAEAVDQCGDTPATAEEFSVADSFALAAMIDREGHA